SDLLLRACTRRKHADTAQTRCRVLRPQRQCTSRHGGADGEPEHAAPVHWITSARSSSVCGIVRPSAFAVLRLTASTYLFGCSIGRSAGLGPLRILSTYTAARRYVSSTFTP